MSDKSLFRFLLPVAVFFLFQSIVPLSAADNGGFQPTATYMFAQRDTCNLFLDVYDPAPESETSVGGRDKPTVLFMFGGGFITGRRDEKSYREWFRMLTGEGYRVVSIDYRLGLKGVGKVGLFQSGKVSNAIEIAVEDLFSATAFLVDNSESLGINPDNIVISGSSAGAISVMQGEWESCNAMPSSSVLPDGFRYAGVMSFSGAIFSTKGTIRYPVEPAPTLMLHGTKDKLVNYGQIWFFNMRFAGSKVIERSLKRSSCNYNFLKFEGLQHEIASSMIQCFPEEIRFLETNVIKKERRVVSASVEQHDIPPLKNLAGRKDIYK